MTTGVIRSGNSTSLGTGTTKTLLGGTAGATVYMPGDAKAILGVYPVIAEITMTTVQSVSARLDLESGDPINIMPYEVMFPPIGAILGATANTLTGRPRWDLGVPLQGGEGINCYGTALVANAVAPEAAAYMFITNRRDDLKFPQRHAKMGTVTSAGTTADTDVAGTKYSFSGGRRLVELYGAVLPVTIAAGDAMVGGIKFTSSEFVDSTPQELPLYPFSFGLGATGSILIPDVSRLSVDIPLKGGTVNIQDYLNCGILPASAAKFISGVVYE